MPEVSIEPQVLEIFKSILRLPSLELKPEMTAKEVAGWTSLSHVRLMIAIEERFKIRFSAPEIIGLKNYGELLNLISEKVSKA